VKNAVLFCTFIFTCGSTFGQNPEKSLYSRFGLGNLSSENFTINAGLAGLGNALIDSSYINFKNPASFSDFNLTVFNTGFSVKRTTVSNASSSAQVDNGEFSNISIGFPIIRQKLGMIFGLKPFSKMGYEVSQVDATSFSESVTYTYRGNGGLNQAFLGLGFRANECFSVGVTGSFLFGNFTKQSDAVINSPNAFNTRVEQKVTVSGFLLKTGLIYSKKLSKGWNTNIGITYNPLVPVNAKRNYYAFSFVRTGISDVPRDTTQLITEEKGQINLWQNVGVGATFTKGHTWMFGLDYNTENLSSYSSFGETELNYGIKQDLILAAQWMPYTKNLQAYQRSIAYRLGGRFTNTGLSISGTAIQEYGITFGIGVPLKKTRTTVNLSVEYIDRGTVNNNLIREKIIEVKFGFSINDKWFEKRKYD